MKRSRFRKPLTLGAALLAMVMSLTACAKPSATPAATAAPGTAGAGGGELSAGVTPNETETGGYRLMKPQDAKKMLDSETDITLVDVREPYEYQTGHIPNAKLLPLGDIAAKAATQLPDRNAKIMVYCRSGSRSRSAARQLLSMGYTHVIDIGGILNWPYDVVTD